MELVLATGNRHKTAEFARMVGANCQVNDLSMHPDIAPAAESGKTFTENAILKALAVSKEVGRLVIADDSGLEVDALKGAPGIYSARYAGERATDLQNIEKLLGELKNIAHRAARFRCVIALARNGEILGTFEGQVKGNIVTSPRGRNGFGYDPIFQPEGFDQTFGEMFPDRKNQISHRAKAIVALREKLSQLEA
ncbi:MAG TPA: RdgB/HAM1 family non-canonical purine NTP pyrophosphatase [Chthoniobacterales bacterium]|nr:RdgB/HAM1 family non-canonical purine NTP pyrophosphatase [Chthoniobacterales bacterium]